MIQTLKNYAHILEAMVAHFLYGFPSTKLKVIGVTGTDGKTTTTNLIYHILSSSHYKTSMISTVGASIGNKIYDTGFHVTTPSSFGVQKYIKKAIDSGSDYLVLETTSHALDQNRIWGIQFDIGVLTNVTHEHLDYHKTHDRYLSAKLKLLLNARTAIVNRDDLSYENIKSKILNSKSQINKKLKIQNFLTYGLKTNSDFNPNNFPFKTKLFGQFNKYNCLAAIAVCRSLGLSDEEIKKGIESFRPPIGRQQIVFDKDFKVMVDFAHTPNAFEVLLKEVRTEIKGRLIHVFGSAGLRDVTKRPLMGEISSRYSDIIVLTAEDSRSEKVEEINKQIAEGVNSKFEIRSFDFAQDKNSKQIQILNIQNDKKYLFEIIDRKEAIKFAIAIAKKGDIVVLTGKGHEKSMNNGNGEEEWDEFEVIKDAISHKK